MRFSLKTLLLITAMIPISMGFVAAVDTQSKMTADWFYSILFPGATESWDDGLVDFLMGMFGIDDSESYFHVTVWASCTSTWIALACVNVFLVWTDHRYFVLLSVVTILMMPFYGIFIGREFSGITIFGFHADPNPALVAVLAQLFGASISAIAIGTFMLLRSCLKRSEIHLKDEQQELKSKYVVLISAFLFFTSMYGWWRINV